MAKPRVFISSTYYDLKNVRLGLSSFVKQMGFDPVLNEQGSVTYGKSKPLDIYCYDEIQNCEILVCLIGGRFGSSSSDGANSITQNELKTALDLGKQVYIFIEKSTLSEYSTYKNNKGLNIKWAFADNEKIFEFIESLFELPFNNTIFPFENSNDVSDILKEQWAGLFQRLLSENSFNGLVTATQEINQGITLLSKILDNVKPGDIAGSSSEDALIDHPIFSTLKRLLKVKYRVFFMSRTEMDDWLSSRNYFKVAKDKWDDPEVEEWIANRYSDAMERHPILKISLSIFDEDGRLTPIRSADRPNKLAQFVMYDPTEDKTEED